MRTVSRTSGEIVYQFSGIGNGEVSEQVITDWSLGWLFWNDYPGVGPAAYNLHLFHSFKN